MGEWKELKVDSLPPDILTSGYEWEYLENFNNTPFWTILPPEKAYVIGILENHMKNIIQYRYRKPELKTPTHKERMSLWWNVSNDTWSKVSSYNASSDATNGSPIYIFDGFVEGSESVSRSYRRYVLPSWFVGKESAIIPPEAK